MNIKKILKGIPDYQVKNDHGVLTYPKTDGVIDLHERNLWYPAKALQEVEYVNICIWYDFTLKPMKGHNGNCRWKFDGQIWRHL